jgi:hypothetical protein
VNPLAPTLADEFDSAGLYEINIDTNADAVTDIAFRMTFTPKVAGMQKGKVRMATGADAARLSASGDVLIDGALVSFGSDAMVTTVGPFSFFAGIRSDPFFFDLLGFLNGLKFTGSDFFIDKNAFSMVLEVPNSTLGPNPHVGIWARCARRQNGKLVQIDRMGRPAINTVFNHGADKNTFNSITPSQDRAQFEASFVATLESFGYSTTDATAIAEILLPDILTYDSSSSAGFLNGRKLTDDVIDIELSLVTNGAVTTDGVGPHTDLLADFPYLGNPHV